MCRRGRGPVAAVLRPAAGRGRAGSRGGRGAGPDRGVLPARPEGLAARGTGPGGRPGAAAVGGVLPPRGGGRGGGPAPRPAPAPARPRGLLRVRTAGPARQAAAGPVRRRGGEAR